MMKRLRGVKWRLPLGESPEGRPRFVTVWKCKRGHVGHAPKELLRRRKANRVAKISRRRNR